MTSSIIDKLPELQVIEAFHVKSIEALGFAKADKLIDDDFLKTATAEELQILGPSLTLFFAAVRNTTNPPYVPTSLTDHYPPAILSVSTCPVALLPPFRAWSKCVEPLQLLELDRQSDVARLLCDLEPQTSPISTRMIQLSADLQSIAIHLSQRQTYLQRYTQDLQAGLGTSCLDDRAQPPPLYGGGVVPDRPPSRSSQHSYSSTAPLLQARRPLPPVPSALPVTPIPETESPAMVAVRETLYAALADVIATSTAVASALRTDPPTGFFRAVALALIEVASTFLTPDGSRVRLIGTGDQRSASLGVSDAPEQLRIFVSEILRLGAVLRDIQTKDDETAIQLAADDRNDSEGLTTMDLLKLELENGPETYGLDDAQIIQIRSIANHVNRVALAVTRLSGFRERSGVFSILLAVLR